MGQRLRGLIMVLVVLAAGVFVGSAISQWKPLPEQPNRPVDRAAALQQVARDIGVAELGRVEVDVRNAGGRAGMAHEATQFLRAVGFDVVDYGNADSFDQDRTVVIDRSGRPEAARAVATALGATVVLEAPDPNLFVDVTVLLGASWDPERALPRATPEPEQPTRWWDLRRFFSGGDPDESVDGEEA